MALLETDPIDVLLTASGDLYVGPNGTKFSSGLTGVAQAAKIRMRLFVNEWFLNLDAGIDWDNVLGEKLDEAFVRTELNREILATPGIIAVKYLNIALNSSTRELDISWQASTQFGDTVPDTLKVPLG